MKKRAGPRHGPGRTKIFRAAHDKTHPYVKVTQAAAQDSRLTFEARGVILYLLSKPDDWHVQLADLMREGHTGKDRALRILQEMETFGYLIWSADRRRVQLPGGRFFWSDPALYEAGNAPCSENPNMEKAEADKPDTGKPEHGKPESGRPESGKPDAYKELTLQRTAGQTVGFSLENDSNEIQMNDTHTNDNEESVCVPIPIDIDQIRRKYAEAHLTQAFPFRRKGIDNLAGWLLSASDGRYDELLVLPWWRDQEELERCHAEARARDEAQLSIDIERQALESAQKRARREEEGRRKQEQWERDAPAREQQRLAEAERARKEQEEELQKIAEQFGHNPKFVARLIADVHGVDDKGDLQNNSSVGAASGRG